MNTETSQSSTFNFSAIKRVAPEGPVRPDVHEARAVLKELLPRIEQLVVPEKVELITELSDVFNRFAVQVSLVGQVKAGKTALSNALLGVSGLLPSDINPWTSVVTTVHVNQRSPKNKKAIFRFFTREMWESMVATGGRIAKLAAEADLGVEADDLRSQIIDMQKKTEARLGKNFELLLDNQHAFSQFNADLVKRYVCLGDEDADDESEGRFADMTRSADLYLESRHFSYPISIIDTPGVNDPFLVREAVTLESLESSEICVIVLSAHQALSTSDLALMRILLNLKQEQIVLFINRVDELADPVPQIEEIRGRIHETLRAQKLPPDLPIIFGSAAWADAHVRQSDEFLAIDAEHTLSKMLNGVEGPVDLSGMTPLQQVLDRKAADDVAAPFYVEVADIALAAAQQSKTLLSKAVSTDRAPRAVVDINEIEDRLASIDEMIAVTCETIEETSSSDLRLAFAGHFNEFAFQQSRGLSQHLDQRGRLDEWAFDTDNLRRQLNQAYVTETNMMQHNLKSLTNKVLAQLTAMYEAYTDEEISELGLTPPELGEPGTPIALMRTMSIDVSKNWLTGWLARRLRREAYLQKFRDATTSQMKMTTVEVEQNGIGAFVDASREALHACVSSHAFSIKELIGLNDEAAKEEFRKKVEQGDTLEDRIKHLTTAISRLEQVIEPLREEALPEERRSA